MAALDGESPHKNDTEAVFFVEDIWDVVLLCLTCSSISDKI